MNRICYILGISLFISCASTSGELVENRSTGAALGTSYSLIYFAEDEVDYQIEIDSVFQAVNRSLSTYISDSDISKINKGDSTLVVDEMFEEVFMLSKNVFEKTNGYFDPTVGVLVNAWGFGPEEQMAMDSTAVDSLLHLVGFDKVAISEKGTVQKGHPDIYFDFNAVAKGYAIDRLAKMFDGKGIRNYLLEVGGELVAKGENQNKGKPWVVGIDDPEMETRRELKKTIYLKNRALASSGNYRKFRVDEKTGKRYVHTVDPKTGYTKSGNTLSATVLANTCAEADAFATAFMAMDLDESFKLLSQQRELDGYIVYIDEHGDTQEFMTEGFEELVVK
ncbi:FAD:protein FMN transferase [Maribacter halichondriae]|uniref:FAD:protein FMN transferase n=1 Tax=Maribacter halichondriae TaxID=2980554 RepID=UPI0023596CB3|nr:FAD:protein FMN transferase [Maribacter sp. Hal144]